MTNTTNDTRIRKLRKERGLSGIQVAEKLNITPQYYYDIEKGERRLTADIASRLADVLHTTTDYLIGKTEVNLFDYILTAEEEKEGEKENSSSHAHEKEFVNNINLTDEELLQQFKLTVDDRELSAQEMKNIIAFVRTLRQS